jgi:hypothetical protein
MKCDDFILSHWPIVSNFQSFKGSYYFTVKGQGQMFRVRVGFSNTVHGHINSKLAEKFSIKNEYVILGHRFPLDRTDVKKRWKRDDFTVKITRICGPLAPILVACTQFRVFCWLTLSPKSLLSADGDVSVTSPIVCLITLWFCVSLLILVGRNCSIFIETEQ